MRKQKKGRRSHPKDCTFWVGFEADSVEEAEQIKRHIEIALDNITEVQHPLANFHGPEIEVLPYDD